MYWWYKDVFVERNYNGEFEYPREINLVDEKSDSPKSSYLRAGISKLLNKINKRLKLKQSAQQMKHLSDQQLADIGLSRNDLNMISKGYYFKKTKEYSGKNNFKSETKLVVIKNSKHSEQTTATPQFQQAA